VAVRNSCVVELGLPNHFTLCSSSSEVALEEPEIGITDPNIPTDNNCTDDELHFGMPGGSGNYADKGDESDVCTTIPTASR
jgi:hypothetical protein